MIFNQNLIFLIVYLTTLPVSISFDSYRLPNHIIPKHYKLKIIASVEDELSFSGSLEIVFQCLNATSEIILHRDWSIQFNKIAVKRIDDLKNYKTTDDIVLNRILYDNKTQFLMISTKVDLKIVQYYMIYFEFEGIFSETNSGILRKQFPITSGTKYYAVSVFEPMGARKAFPCFDEPGFLTTFELSIGRKKNYNSTSNMQLLKSEPIENKQDWYWDHYMKSLPMSTHLLYFMVYDSEFSWIGKREDPIRILSRKEMKNSLGMASSTSSKLMTYLQNFFRIPFPFPKLDIIALPHRILNNDHISAPGVIIMYEEALVYHPFGMTRSDVQKVLDNLAEALTLQWMCLISVDWWSNMWIKKSLALTNTRKALDEMTKSSSVEIDLSNAILHSFRLPVIKSIEESSVENGLSFVDLKKSIVILRMASFILGSPDLKEISIDFLKQYSFQTVNPLDFWRKLESFASKRIYKERTLDQVITSWTNQGLYPEIIVMRNYESGVATIQQKVYDSFQGDEYNCWWIPLVYVTRSEPNENNVRGWINCTKETTKIENLSSTDWLLFNFQVNSLSRVFYDHENYKLLQSSLRNPSSYKSIPSLNRMQLLNDLYVLTEKGYSTYDFFFEFIEFIRFDNSYSPWAAFAMHMFNLHWRIQSDDEAEQLLSIYMQYLVKPHFDARKLVAKTNDITFEILITEFACFFELSDCKDEVRENFMKYRKMKLSNNVNYPFTVDLREIVFCYAIKYDSRDNFDYLQETFIKSTNVFERRDMLKALHCVKDSSLIENISNKNRVTRSAKNMRRKYSEVIEHFPETLNKLVAFQSVNNTSEYSTKETTLKATTVALLTADADTSKSTQTPVDTMPIKRNETSSSEFISKIEERSTTQLAEYTKTLEISGDITETVSADDNLSNLTDIETTTSIETFTAEEKEEDQYFRELNFEHIVSRYEFKVVSNIFYKSIRTLNRQDAFNYIWLFTERINTYEDLNKLKKLLSEINLKFIGMEDNISKKIKDVEQKLKNRTIQKDLIINALKKNLELRGLRSNSSRAVKTYLFYFLSVLGILEKM